MDQARQTVLVTGATRGIGWEIADLFAARGYNLVVTGRDEDKLQQFKAKHAGSIVVQTAVADLSTPQGVPAVFDASERAGVSVDILINLRGSGITGLSRKRILGSNWQ
jgi:hypothetical protein